MCLFKRLHQLNRCSVLIEIAHGTVEKLLWSLPVSQIQDSIEDIFFYLLLGYQHSEILFHQLVTSLPRVFSALACQEEEHTLSGSKALTPKIQQIQTELLNQKTRNRRKTILKRLTEAVCFLTTQFPEFSELYKPLSAWVTNSNVGPSRMEELQSLSWLSYNSAVCTSNSAAVTTGQNPSDASKNVHSPSLNQGKYSPSQFFWGNHGFS